MNTVGFNIIPKSEIDLDVAAKEIFNIHKSVGWTETDDRISLRRLHEDANVTYFARDNTTQKIIGYVTAKPITSHGSNREISNWYVSFIAVDKTCQSKGCGRELMQKIFEMSINSKSSIHLDCQEYLKDFYEKICHPSFEYSSRVIRQSYYDPNTLEYDILYKFKEPTNNSAPTLDDYL